MNEIIFWILETEIGENKLDELKSLMTEMTENTKANEPGTLNYEWFISEDSKKCYLFERFENSDALLVHLSSFMKNYAGRFMEILKVKKFELFGNPGDAARDKMNKMGVKYNSPLGGFLR